VGVSEQLELIVSKRRLSLTKAERAMLFQMRRNLLRNESLTHLCSNHHQVDFAENLAAENPNRYFWLLLN
jgi:hypothetical protein